MRFIKVKLERTLVILKKTKTNHLGAASKELESKHGREKEQSRWIPKSSRHPTQKSWQHLQDSVSEQGETAWAPRNQPEGLSLLSAGRRVVARAELSKTAYQWTDKSTRPGLAGELLGHRPNTLKTKEPNMHPFFTYKTHVRTTKPCWGWRVDGRPVSFFFPSLNNPNHHPNPNPFRLISLETNDLLCSKGFVSVG